MDPDSANTPPATQKEETLLYKRSHFVTRLPKSRLYTPAHFWLKDMQQAEEETPDPQKNSLWRVGATKFATRMLGEMVDHGYEQEAETSVEPGQVIGWLEGFKAVSDLFCSVSGIFKNGNPSLMEDLTCVNRHPFQEGWLYEVQGVPDDRAMDVYEYQRFLDQVIDQLLEKDPNLGAGEES